MELIAKRKGREVLAELNSAGYILVRERDYDELNSNWIESEIEIDRHELERLYQLMAGTPG